MTAYSIRWLAIIGWIIQTGFKRYIALPPFLVANSMMLKIGDAGAKGKGVFAASTIEPGDVVLEYDGEVRWIWDIPRELWPFAFQVDYDRYIVPERGSAGWYLNHSCEPNCVIRGKRRITALVRIDVGEEVTIDYSTNVGWDGFAMECNCGSPTCRKVIRSYHYLDDQQKRRYGACVSPFLLERDAPAPQSA